MSTFHVTMQFQADGPAVEGAWVDGEIALGRYRDWVGSHGSLDGVLIRLTEETTDGHVRVIRAWTKDHGEHQPSPAS
ncbi:hypothetical protein [Streptomyces marianii]|uniref:hypothetical protein n=1 Tax=Streptomyces marianii TaxID=1817406 RepID=UPI001F3C043D|nr:hypothetical protein [Streptomyces marianii]